MSRRYLILFAVFLMGACADRNSTSVVSSGETVVPLPSPIPTFTFAAEIPTGWDEIKIISGYAEVKIGTSGHFTTSRNACLVQESGAIDLADWNVIVRSLKASLAAPVLPEPEGLVCKPMADVPRGLDGTIDLKLPSGTRSLFMAMGAEICTTIGDAAAAKELLDAINHVLLAAALEGCSSATP